MDTDTSIRTACGCGRGRGGEPETEPRSRCAEESGCQARRERTGIDLDFACHQGTKKGDVGSTRPGKKSALGIGRRDQVAASTSGLEGLECELQAGVWEPAARFGRRRGICRAQAQRSGRQRRLFRASVPSDLAPIPTSFTALSHTTSFACLSDRPPRGPIHAIRFRSVLASFQ